MSALGRHEPVMTDEIVAALAPRAGGVYLDGTFGGGGHARAILESADCFVIAIDRDPDAIRRGEIMRKDYRERLILIEGRFGDMLRLLRESDLPRLFENASEAPKVDGVALDLGFSSFQMDDPQRGFSFQQDAPLDMRMEARNSKSKSAAEWIGALSEAELAEVIWRYGEERRARSIARAIVKRRKETPITRTGELAALVKKIVGHAGRIHPATRTFQALRILVNNELEELARGLSAAEQLLKEGGRLAVITFHSLEDRIVKHFLIERSGRAPNPSRHLPPAHNEAAPSFALMGAGVQRPSAEEVARNPRARSARLRAAERAERPAAPSHEISDPQRP